MPAPPPFSFRRPTSSKALSGWKKRSVLSLGIVQGTVIQLIADGPDAEEAVEALAELLSGDFGE